MASNERLEGKGFHHLFYGGEELWDGCHPQFFMRIDCQTRVSLYERTKAPKAVERCVARADVGLLGRSPAPVE